jgi:hypothetical protein
MIAPKPAPWAVSPRTGSVGEAGTDNLLAGLRPSFPDLLSELRALGFRPYLEGPDGAEILKCKGPRYPTTGLVQHLPQPLVAEVREARPALIRALLAERWETRADQLFAHFTAAGFPTDEAERLGYGNLLFEWHVEHVRCVGRKLCAECGQRGGPLMPAGDGNFLCRFKTRMLRQLYPSLARRGGRRVARARDREAGGACLICRWRRFE